MKYLLLIVPMLFIGCTNDEPRNPKFQALIDAHNGQTKWYECSEYGFLEEHFIWDTPSSHNVYLVLNDANVPTRCNVKDTSIRVKESVATGVLSGDVR